MNYKGKSISIERKTPSSLGDLMPMMMKSMRLSSGMNEFLVTKAWDSVTGAAAYTLSKYVKNGVLYCAISSSVIRNQLFYNKEAIVEAINRSVLADPFYNAKEGVMPLKSIILK